MSTTTLRIGTRGSELALWQANHVADQLRARGHQVSVEIIRTTGDRMQDPAFKAPATFDDGSPLDAKGIFIKEIEDALAAGRIDVAVHSLKDLPTQLDPRFTLAAIPPRADARDAFVCESFWGLHMLPMGARIGTTSPRRKAMLLSLRPDLRFVELRGNVDTRLRKWQEGQADALVLAAAGLDRLNRAAHVHQRFAIDELCPAPGQGALAIETRCPHYASAPKNVLLSEDGSPGESGPRATPPSTLPSPHSTALKPPSPPPRSAPCLTRSAAAATSRSVPSVDLSDDTWHLHAMVVSPDGEQIAHVIERAPSGVSPEEFGQRAAASLKDRGALELLTPLTADSV